MVHYKYVDGSSVDKCLGHFVEEIGECLQAYGKVQRFGLLSRHPDEPQGETNKEYLLREIGDLEGAILRLKKVL